MLGSVEHSEWAVRCGCGEIMAQADEDAARRTVQLWNTQEVAHRHGAAKLVCRRVVITDWREIHEPAAG